MPGALSRRVPIEIYHHVHHNVVKTRMRVCIIVAMVQVTNKQQVKQPVKVKRLMLYFTVTMILPCTALKGLYSFGLVPLKSPIVGTVSHYSYFEQFKKLANLAVVLCFLTIIIIRTIILLPCYPATV